MERFFAWIGHNRRLAKDFEARSANRRSHVQCYKRADPDSGQRADLAGDLCDRAAGDGLVLQAPAAVLAGTGRRLGSSSFHFLVRGRPKVARFCFGERTGFAETDARRREQPSARMKAVGKQFSVPCRREAAPARPFPSHTEGRRREKKGRRFSDP